MLLRAFLFSVLVTACYGTPGKLSVDSPALPYEPPDISEITGIDEEEEEEMEQVESTPAPTAAPTPTPAATGTGAAPGAAQPKK